MGDEDREDIQQDRDEVAEEATPETDIEAAEQRTDDYDGIVRRLDDIMRLIDERFDSMRQMLDALGVAAVESDGIVESDAQDIAGAAAAAAVDEILGIDSLDLL
jgi:hypothetical protein